MLVLGSHEIPQNRKESWFPKLQNVLEVTLSNKNIEHIISHIDTCMHIVYNYITN